MWEGLGEIGPDGRLRQLPAWLFRKQWVRIGGHQYSLNDEAVQNAARLGGAMPPCGYHVMCQWHPGFPLHPRRWRMDALAGLPVGALGITGVNRVTWVVDDPDGARLDPARGGGSGGGNEGEGEDEDEEATGEQVVIGGSAPSIAALAVQWGKLNHAAW